MAQAPGAAMALATFELENNVQPVDGNDAVFRYDAAAQRAADQQKPWRDNPHYFKHVRVSALALVKMTMHCRSGGNLEVMGMMQGKVVGDTFIVLDSFALPVEGTETRVNAGNEANEYMVEVVEMAKSIGRPEHLVGWYHSHPGYGCWMSGIDCSTQQLNQQYQEPWLALIIDPIRTCSAGKVEIGGFRTYPEGYKAPEDRASEYQTIPLGKVEDWGVHADQYYSLDVSFFKSSLDLRLLELLWHKYWVHTLSASPLALNRAFVAGQLGDLAAKLEAAEAAQQHYGGGGGGLAARSALARKGEDSALTKIARDAAKATLEQSKGLASQMVKAQLFNSAAPAAAAAVDAPMPDAPLA